MSDTRFSGIHLYVGVLFAGLLAILVWVSLDPQILLSDLHIWLLFTGFLIATEYSDFNFHDESGRIGLSASEAVLFPMLLALPLPQVVWAGVLAVAVREIRRLVTVKGLFNVAEYGCAIAASAFIWDLFAATDPGLSISNAVVGAVAVLAFALFTHLFTSGAIALAESRNFLVISRSALGATFSSVFGSVLLGALFAAAYSAARWTIVLFPLVIAVFFVGYRAMLRQQQERQRVESLHSATRALAASPDLSHAVTGFLEAVEGIASTAEARLILVSEGGDLSWWGVRSSDVLTHPGRFDEVQMMSLVTRLRDGSTPIMITEYETGEGKGLANEIGMSSLVAVPVMTGDAIIGALAVIDRVGTDEFTDGDVRLLEALSNELAVTLESYKLFAQVVEERERFARIFNGSKEGICLLDSEGVVRAWNPALETITGHPGDSLMDKPWSDVVLIRDKAEHRLVGDELIGAEPDEELELVTKSGPSRWVTVLAGPVGETEGGGWVVLVRDVSAEHEIEAAKSDFLSTISHELRTPLTTIKGSLQVLGRGRDKLPPELVDQMIGVTTRGAERLERLVMNLLAVSQIESGTMPVFPDELALGEAVQERVAAMLKDHDRTVISVPEKPLVVRADRERMSHVIEHVLENALKFGGSGGEIRISLARENGYALLSVTDEGPGIPTADRERIFERFVRLGDVLTRETQGAGVGLFIAARSVQAMGGEIWVDSTVGKGSTFYVTVPLAHPVAVEDSA